MTHPLMASGLALIIGGMAGLLGFLIGMPLPWMLGPMIGVTIAALLRAPIKGPDGLRYFVIPAIGVMLGSAVNADTIGQLSTWGATLILLPLFLIVAAGASYTVYRRVGGYDTVTAFYCAMPGGLNEMLLLGEAAGGDGKRIALAHASRVLLVIFFVVLYFGIFLGVRSNASNTAWIALNALTIADYAMLIACGVVGVPLAKLIRLPAAPVFGPMILSGAAHIAGWVTVPPPSIIIILAQIVIGTVIGSRFLGSTPREILRDVGLAIPASLLMLIVAVGAAEIVVLMNDMPLSQSFLAYSPGGLTEMSLLTLTMGHDVAFVSITHIIRITVVIGVAPYVFAALRHRL